MKTHLECVPCITRQVLGAAEFSGADQATRERVLRKGLQLLNTMSWDSSPMEMAKAAHSLVRRETGVNDPYRSIKNQSNQRALEWIKELHGTDPCNRPSIDTALRLAVAGNIVDYGANRSVDLDGSINKLRSKPLAVSDRGKLLDRLADARTIAYIGDNAGEIVFDRILLETIHRTYAQKPCLFVTRKEPFINDALLEDARATGVADLPGVEMAAMYPVAPTAMTDLADRRTWQRIRNCGVIISKGQGNYEAFSEEPNIFFLLVVKCQVVARDLGSRTGTPLKIGDLVLWKS